jgi:hypothetical protein
MSRNGKEAERAYVQRQRPEENKATRWRGGVRSRLCSSRRVRLVRGEERGVST